MFLSVFLPSTILPVAFFVVEWILKIEFHWHYNIVSLGCMNFCYKVLHS